jgi:XTP/dITP diphosphohydrolase
MEVYLATGNPHKVEEIHAILKPFGIIVKKAVDCHKIEPKDWPIEKVATENAKRLADASGKPTLVDDSGCFFTAYKNFPGALSQWSFSNLGYKGLLKVLEGENRNAMFRCAAAVCFPGKEPQVFFGEMKGRILETPVDAPTTQFPYERIFVIDGFDKAVCHVTREEKNACSHRGTAFRELGSYLEGLEK